MLFRSIELLLKFGCKITLADLTKIYKSDLIYKYKKLAFLNYLIYLTRNRKCYKGYLQIHTGNRLKWMKYASYIHGKCGFKYEKNRLKLMAIAKYLYNDKYEFSKMSLRELSIILLLHNKNLNSVYKDRKSTRLNSSHSGESRMPSSA